MNFQEIPPLLSPSAWLDLDAIDHNIQLVNNKLNGKRLRIASKSVRCIEVLKYVAEKSPNYIGIMSYDALETKFLLENGFTDILCAYPQMNQQAILTCEQTVSELQKTLSKTHNKQIKVTWMVDKPEHWALLNDIGKVLNKKLRVSVDINTSSKYLSIYFGTQRSALETPRKLKKLLKKHMKFGHTELVGLMGYEGQIAGLPEQLPEKEILAPAIRLLKSRSKKHVAKLRQSCVDVISDLGLQLEYVNGGGSGSLDWTCAQPEITEITVGSAYFMPAYFSYMDTMQAFKPSAGFVLPVTRKPYSKTVTCQSGGFVASGSVGKDKWPVIHFPKDTQYLADEGCGEVQTPIKLMKKSQLTIGDNVWFRHAKAGELCEHFNELLVFRNSKQINTFATYRGQGQCFH